MKHADRRRTAALVCAALVSAGLLYTTLSGRVDQPLDEPAPFPTGDPSSPTPTHVPAPRVGANQTGTP